MARHGWARSARAEAAGGLALAVALAWGCTGPWTKAAVPVPVQQLQPMPEGGSCLFVFLPGRGDRVGVYRREGFASGLVEQGIRAEAIEVDLHFGYYSRRLAHTRLHEDVIVPARARGVSEIWFVGVSLGALGALIYDQQHPGQVTSMVLLAPFLGEEKVIDEIAASGGLAGWTPRLPLDPDDWQRDIWRYLKGRADAPGPRPKLLLGYGLKDRVARSNRLLADVLPDDQVFTTPGGHDWSEWRELWKMMLASGQVKPSLR